MRSADTAHTITAHAARVLPQTRAWAVLLGWACCAAAPPEVVVELPSSKREGDAEALSVRATDLVALDLARLGAAVWPRPATPLRPVAGTAPLLVTVRVEGRGIALLARVGAHTATTSDTLEGLDAAATRLARTLGPRLGLPVPEGAVAVLGSADPTPALVHRTLGQAALDLIIGQPQRARLRFGRAEEIWRSTQLPAALDGTWAAIVRSARAREDVVGTADPLARSALEASEMAERDRARPRAVSAAASALRYWTDRAMAWAIPLDPAVEVVPGEQLWWLIDGDGDRAIEPRTGGKVRELRGAGRGLGPVGDDVLRLDGATLLRLTDAGLTRWKRALPWKDAHVDLGALAGGFLLVRADKGLAWIDASTGAIAQADPGAVALAVGLDGALVRLAGGELALLRPGRRAPSWTLPGFTSARATMVPGRVLLLDDTCVRVVDTATGKLRGGKLNVGADPRWLGAEGRYAIAASGREAVILDALGANELARVVGPGEPTAATASDTGIALAFETGDVFLVDREGVVADRARVIGRPRAVWPGRPHAPGFLVRTDRGLIALGPVPTRERGRDVDVALRLAELSRAEGDVRGALRLAERVALGGAGRVAEAETLRAALLDGDRRPAVKAAAAAARRRATAARDLGLPLPPFALR